MTTHLATGPHSPLRHGPLLLRLGRTVEGDAVRVELDGARVGLVVSGERPPVLALARSLLVQLASQSEQLLRIRSDGMITIGEEPVVALQIGQVDRSPPAGVPRLQIDDVPWARLEHEHSVRLRCELTSRAQFRGLVEAACLRRSRLRGRHVRADENGGIPLTSELIS